MATHVDHLNRSCLVCRKIFSLTTLKVKTYTVTPALAEILCSTWPNIQIGNPNAPNRCCGTCRSTAMFRDGGLLVKPCAKWEPCGLPLGGNCDVCTSKVAKVTEKKAPKKPQYPKFSTILNSKLKKIDGQEKALKDLKNKRRLLFQADEHLFCGICKNVVEQDFCLTTCCSRFVCQTCLISVLNETQENLVSQSQDPNVVPCPVCLKESNIDKFLPPAQSLQNFLTINLENSRISCQWCKVYILYKNILQHECSRFKKEKPAEKHPIITLWASCGKMSLMMEKLITLYIKHKFVKNINMSI
jgi:hypothetical protein